MQNPSLFSHDDLRTLRRLIIHGSPDKCRESSPRACACLCRQRLPGLRARARPLKDTLQEAQGRRTERRGEGLQSGLGQLSRGRRAPHRSDQEVSHRGRTLPEPARHASHQNVDHRRAGQHRRGVLFILKRRPNWPGLAGCQSKTTSDFRNSSNEKPSETGQDPQSAGSCFD